MKVLDPVFRFLIQFLFLTQQHVIKPSPHRQNCCQKMVHLLLLHFWIPRSMSCNAPSHSLGKKTKESAWISMTLVYRVRLLLEFRQNMKVGFIQYTGDPRLLQTHYCNFAKFSVKGLSRDIHIECSKQFEWNLYFYRSGQSGLFWAELKLPENSSMKFK